MSCHGVPCSESRSHQEPGCVRKELPGDVLTVGAMDSGGPGTTCQTPSRHRSGADPCLENASQGTARHRGGPARNPARRRGLDTLGADCNMGRAGQGTARHRDSPALHYDRNLLKGTNGSVGWTWNARQGAVGHVESAAHGTDWHIAGSANHMECAGEVSARHTGITDRSTARLSGVTIRHMEGFAKGTTMHREKSPAAGTLEMVISGNAAQEDKNAAGNGWSMKANNLSFCWAWWAFLLLQLHVWNTLAQGESKLFRVS
ncbi:hypothetical protein NDU88_001575 [Pleurodeles waltl]|uniref:Uncharacterized protein n=1 Tax=Pleurodeles waltl TaxID=8319 RepID=A0AAV7M5Q0_PLEWA|nr:hypothetical protein NDU88_001575 [Pleurodeles waltl]